MLHGSTKPTQSDIRLFSRRLLVVKLVVFLGFVVLVSRLAWLQIHQYNFYQGLSSNNSIRTNFLSPARGRIFDRDGQILATNRPAYTLEVLPEAAGDIETLVEQVRELIHLSEEEEQEFFRRLHQSLKNDLGTALLKENLTLKEVAIVASQLYRLNGLSIGNFLRRVYPDGAQTSTFLGHMGRITPEDWQRIDQNRYVRHGHIGKTGLEIQHEDLLYGRPGYSYVEVDAHGRIHRELDRKPAIPGMDLYTNISLVLQKKAAELLEGYRGAIVALVPSTGDVLVLHSAPSFDNNEQVYLVTDDSENADTDTESADTENADAENADTDTENAAAIKKIPRTPLFNRATNGVYPPASTIKPVLSMHPDLDTLMPVTEKQICKGSQRVGRRTFFDWKKSGHGALTLVDSIAQSCDIYFYRLALALGVERLAESLIQFGFGQATGIDLPSENTGLVPSAAWKLRRFNDVWRDGDTANTGIGQGFMLATPLQMAVATATLANRGLRTKPKLFRAWEQPSAITQTSTEVVESELVESVALPEEWLARLDPVLSGMHEVIHSPKGTARRLARGFEAFGVEAAGKTGTAQVVRIKRNEISKKDDQPEILKDHSLFIGFAPFENPSIAVAVVVENAGNGSAVAAPIGGKIMLEWLDLTSKPDETASATVPGN